MPKCYCRQLSARPEAAWAGWQYPACVNPGLQSGYAQDLPSMPVPDPDSPNERQLRAAAELLASVSPDATALGDIFAAAGHELALVGGSVRDIFLGRTPGDLDLTTDAPPRRVLELVQGWADQFWTIGIDFGTVGIRKGRSTFEITTYRSERYDRTSRKPVVAYGTSLEDDLARRDFTVNAMAARL